MWKKLRKFGSKLRNKSIDLRKRAFSKEYFLAKKIANECFRGEANLNKKEIIFNFLTFKKENNIFANLSFAKREELIRELKFRNYDLNNSERRLQFLKLLMENSLTDILKKVTEPSELFFNFNYTKRVIETLITKVGFPKDKMAEIILDNIELVYVYPEKLKRLVDLLKIVWNPTEPLLFNLKPLEKFLIKLCIPKTIDKNFEVVLGAEYKLEGVHEISLINKRGEQVIGWFACNFSSEYEILINVIQGKKGEIKTMRTIREKTKKPWANHIMDRLIEIAKESGIKKIYLKNPAHNFYLPETESENPGIVSKILRKKYKFKGKGNVMYYTLDLEK